MTDRFAIARVGELAPGQTKKFLFQLQGQEVEGFLLNVGGQHHAYVNRCRHVPMSLDWVENQFFTEESVVAITGKSLHTPRYRTPPSPSTPSTPAGAGPRRV